MNYILRIATYVLSMSSAQSAELSDQGGLNDSVLTRPQLQLATLPEFQWRLVYLRRAD